MSRTRSSVALIGALSLLVLAAAAPAAAAKPDRSYIVVLERGAEAPAAAAKQARAHGASVKHVYTHALKGFSAVLSEDEVRELRADPSVKYVVKDGIARIDGPKAKKRPTNGGSGLPWGLDRIDQRNLPLSKTAYDPGDDGQNVTAYVVDTGIRITHQQFGGRAVYGWDAVDNDTTASDCNGHGTHVAGTIGGSTFGVANKVKLVAIRVLGCGGSGTWSGVIAGVDWAVGNHAQGTPAVMNLSLGGGANQAVDDAIKRAVGDGITVAVAAGNSAYSACNDSPAREPSALTVGATTSTDARASYSNTGTCVDIFAPGSSILSAWSTGDTATNTISGTSMASPHVAGVAALYLSISGNGSKTPAQVASALIGNSTGNVLTGVGTGSPNKLLFENYSPASAGAPLL